MTLASINKTWPSQPYKGLSFYRPEDAPLYAGRDHDILRLGQHIAEVDTRLMILHGKTGCGKSSLLRAGLIPFLESQADFQFLKERNQLRAIFVRSTDKPLIELAQTIYKFAIQDVVVHTPNGDYPLGLGDIVSNMPIESFVETFGQDSELLIDVLSKIARKVSRTIVLIVDQAEEVITLNTGVKGDLFRHEFFSFLSLMSKTQIELKLIVALRSEYFGEFFDEISLEEFDFKGVKVTALKDLTTNQIIQAITRPTQSEPIENYGIPYDHYQFQFESGLPEKIASDLEFTPSGGRLPALQIVCDRLYANTKPSDSKQPWTIYQKDYDALGGIEQQQEENINRELKRLCVDNGFKSEFGIEEEVAKWKDVLATLAREQPDGTFTSDLNTIETIKEKALEIGCKIDVSRAISYLTLDEVRILRHENLIKLGTREVIECYSLGHDAIGLVLNKWSIGQQEVNSLRVIIRGMFGAFGLISGLTGFAFTYMGASSLVSGIFWFYTVLFFLITFSRIFERSLLPFGLMYLRILPRSLWGRVISDKTFANIEARYPRFKDYVNGTRQESSSRQK